LIVAGGMAVLALQGAAVVIKHALSEIRQPIHSTYAIWLISRVKTGRCIACS
jgi:hypothetical protein